MKVENLLKKIKEETKLSNLVLSKNLGVSELSIKNWINSISKPSLKNEVKIREFYKKKCIETIPSFSTTPTVTGIQEMYGTMTEKNKYLKDARIEAGLSQKDIAELLNVAPATVQAWERGIFAMSEEYQKQLKTIIEFNKVKTEVVHSEVKETLNFEFITNDKGEQMVNARDLHSTLEIKARYTEWLFRNITNNEFLIEGEDFVKYIRTDKNNQEDVILTLNTAKKVAMRQHTVKGESIRNYFIKMEGIAKQSFQLALPSYQIHNPIERAKIWIEEEKVREKLVLENDFNKPKVAYHDNVLNCADSFSITEIAKGLGTTANQLNKYLCSQKIQFRRGNKYFLYSKYDRLGYININTVEIEKKDGTKSYSNQMFWTNKGKKFIISLFTNKYNDYLPQIPLL